MSDSHTLASSTPNTRSLAGLFDQGEIIGDSYEVRQLLGAGGMGVVYGRTIAGSTGLP